MSNTGSQNGAASNPIGSGPCIVGLGEVLWDLLPTGKSLGGAPANFAFHANQLGARGVVVSAVGSDELGQEIRTRLAGLALSEIGLRKVQKPTGTVTVAMSEGQPTYTIHTNVAWDELPWDEGLHQLASQADAVCFGSLAQRAETSRGTIQTFLDVTSQDCLRIFDINLRQQFYNAEVIRSSLARAHVLKLNHEELPIVAQLLGIEDSSEDERLRKLLRRFHLRLIALTRGAHGSRLYTKWRVSDHPGYPVSKFVDAVGAGDSFTAALTVGLLKFQDLDQVHDHAAKVASYVCSQSGATPELPESLR